MRFGAAVATSAFAVAIASGVGAYALTTSNATSDPTTAASAWHAPSMGRAQDTEALLALYIPNDEAVIDQPVTASAPSEGHQLPAEATPEPAPEPIAAHAAVVQATPAATAVAVVTPEPSVVASRTDLYSTIAAAFPEQSDKAYRVVMCESDGNAATNTGNGYYGLWQFDLQTWWSVGGAGLPSGAAVEDQVMRARMLYERRGWGPWDCA